MDLREEFDPRLPLVRAYGPRHFVLATTRVEGTVLVVPEGWVRLGPRSLAQLKVSDLEAATEADPPIELLLIGSGRTIVEPPAALKEVITQAGWRHEVMATPPALRSFNLLLLDGRRVAGLFVAAEM
ncbi:MAG: hypothetical protein D6740_13025 [Alphaproteobacteria bacterium]|nr:MAG: hypothetical protein D6740_13025 [Alphaproteobacteria bacterium]